MDQIVRRFSHGVSTQFDLDQLSASSPTFLLDPNQSRGRWARARGEALAAALATVGLRSPERIAENAQQLRAYTSDRPLLLRLPEEARIDGLLARSQPAQVPALPIGLQGRPLVAIVLAADTAFGADALGRLEVLRQVLGLALNNAIAHEHLERLAALDAPTDAYNRRFRLKRLQEEFGRPERARRRSGS
jgi:hypothetical protein